MPLYLIQNDNARQALSATEGGEILRYTVDTAPSRAPDATTWVGVGVGLPRPVEITLALDATNLPTDAKSLADAFANAAWIGIAASDGTPLLERRALAMTRFSLPNAEARWGRIRVTLLIDAPVYQADYIWDGVDTLWDGTDLIYGISEV